MLLDNSQVMQILEAIIESGSSPDDACADSPDLLPEVLQRLRAFHLIEAQLESLFPSKDGMDQLGATLQSGDTLPSIPGYEVESVLGHGGMGVVYRARHVKLDRPVAIKMLLAGVHASLAARACFLNEAEAVARLNHPHVVHIYDFGEIDGRPYFTMEFAGGGTLGDKLAGIPRPGREAAALVSTLADAVEFAHRRGIVHRDLKPSNILLNEEGAAKVSDFGLARDVSDAANVTLTGVRVGTPSYMAPEQALGKASAIGPATDVYALGAILYELLTGRPPFRGENSEATLRQVIEENPAAPSRLNAQVPRDLETICLKCLRKDPGRRYATVSALGDDLRRFRAGEPILARPVGPLERATKWMRRRPGATAAAAASLLLVAALSVTMLSWAMRRTAATRMADTYLDHALELERNADWAAARVEVWHARAWAEDRGTPRVRRRALDAERDLDLVEALAAIRSDRATATHPHFNTADVDRQYQEAFGKFGVGTIGQPAAAVAARIRSSPVRAAVVAALDDWAFCFNDESRRLWLLDVARRADPDPWRDRVRNVANWGDLQVLNDLAASADLKRESVPLLLVLGGLLSVNNGDGVSFHRRVQAAHPDDFWANFVFAELLDERDDADAVGFYRVALALRPNAPASNVNLAMSLQKRGHVAEATTYWNRALNLAPSAPMVHHNVGIALMNDGKTAEAIHEFRQALKLDPDFPFAHAALGHALLSNGRLVEANSELRRALELLPPAHALRVQVNQDLSESAAVDNAEATRPPAAAPP